MFPPLFRAAGFAAGLWSCAALAQFIPPPGSAQGTESGSYGSSIGFDVRGTAPVDRFGRPNDPFNPTDTADKPADPRNTREKRDPDADRIGVPANARSPGDSRGGYTPGANMNPGLSPGAPGGTSPGTSPSMNPGMSPNMNPGMGPAAGSRSGASPGAGAGGRDR